MGDREWWQNDRDRIDDERRWGECQLPCKTLKQKQHGGCGGPGSRNVTVVAKNKSKACHS